MFWRVRKLILFGIFLLILISVATAQKIIDSKSMLKSYADREIKDKFKYDSFQIIGVDDSGALLDSKVVVDGVTYNHWYTKKGNLK